MPLLLDCPPTVTKTSALCAPTGTCTVIHDCPVAQGSKVGAPGHAIMVNGIPGGLPSEAQGWFVAQFMDGALPKLLPVITKPIVAGPSVRDRLVIMGVAVNGTPLLCMPFTVTITLPVITPAGTMATMVVGFQVGKLVPVIPPNVTVLLPFVDPKLTPVIVTELPAPPPGAERLEIPGPGFEAEPTTKSAPLLDNPFTVKTTNPVVAPEGTGTLMEPVVQFVGTAATPLNVTVLVPCGAPKFDPEIVTAVVTGPTVGLRPVMFGYTDDTVKFTLLL